MGAAPAALLLSTARDAFCLKVCDVNADCQLSSERVVFELRMEELEMHQSLFL